MSIKDVSTDSKNADPFISYRNQRIGLRSDLQISRQLTKGSPAYVIYDPVSFQSHRLSLTDYRVAACLEESRTLDQAFRLSLAEGFLVEEDEADFFQFVSRLESLGLLTSSNHDSKALFNRFKQKTADARKAKWLGFLFLTIPLSNPDKFLDRTVNRFRFLFSSTALLVWIVLGCFAVALVINKWSAFIEPLNGLLAVKNLIFMSIAFVALKVWHELGHGYACKHFGGRIPEMGCKLMAGVPLAYVDASSAWSFPKRRHRIIVMLGGMYFETIVAIPAALLWAFTPDSLIGACAYQLIFMAGVATVFFNANPLMKYDGYFILSDLLSIPNLRSRASRESMNLLKRYCLGLSLEPRAVDSKERTILITYGVLSTAYTTMLMISIPLMLASRFQVLGLLVGACQLTASFYMIPRKLHKYLLHAPETEPVRARARKVAYGLAIGVPLVLLIFPVPTGMMIEGVVSAEKLTVLRATTPGIIRSVDCEPRTAVNANQTLLTIHNLDLDVASQTGAIAAEAAKRSAHFVSRLDITEAAKLKASAIEREVTAAYAQSANAELTVRAPHAGRVSYIVPRRAVGTYVFSGDPVAELVSGQTIVRAWLDEAELQAADLRVGSKVNVRTADRAASNLVGTIRSVAPASAAEFEDLALTTSGEGNILIHPVTGETTKPLFQLQISVPSLGVEQTQQESRAFVLVGRKYESIGNWIVRNTHKFITSTLTN